MINPFSLDKDGSLRVREDVRMEDSDFVSNVNHIAKHIDFLRVMAVNLDLTNSNALIDLINTDFINVLADIKKGATDDGYRKMDIDLEINMKEPTDIVYYDKATVHTTDGKQHVIKFTKEVYSLIDVNFQLMTGIAALQDKALVVNTVCEIVPKIGSVFAGIGRIKDSLETFGVFSNVRALDLHVAARSLNESRGDGVFHYKWYTTTSSILTLHTSLDSVMDILNRIEVIYADFLIKYEDFIGKYDDVDKWYKEIVIMHTEIKKMYNHILIMYEEIKNWHAEIMEAVEVVQNAVLNSTPYIIITEDTVLESKHLGSMLQCVVPLDTDIITLTVPDKTDKDEAWRTSAEILFVPKGKGTVLIKSGGAIVIESQEGTAPMSKGNGRVACAKVEPDGTWLVFGALEDI